MAVWLLMTGGRGGAGGPEREGADWSSPTSSREKLGIGPEAPPDNPVMNFMMSETRIRKDGSQGFRVTCQGSQDSTRSATGIRGKSTETKEGIPMIISGGSRLTTSALFPRVLCSLGLSSRPPRSICGQ
ncbi:uncharacterized protein B0T23DRAFT_21758 [Neurospora hispaniola]|uniref:Uncharacterized protein n=1 Tax=Neurospora hispaniola TaxID=588809 RepID=A0AAJ0IFW1_9PEZI|nr:hypothetical protein B0T23DRAFT_21758 [Neurospora hispaniola]